VDAPYDASVDAATADADPRPFVAVLCTPVRGICQPVCLERTRRIPSQSGMVMAIVWKWTPRPRPISYLLTLSQRDLFRHYAASCVQDLALLVQQFYDPQQRDRVKEIGTRLTSTPYRLLCRPRLTHTSRVPRRPGHTDALLQQFKRQPDAAQQAIAHLRTSKDPQLQWFCLSILEVRCRAARHHGRGPWP